MGKLQIEIEDTLQECVDGAIEEVQAHMLEWMKENKPDDCPCIGNDLDYSGRVHEIIDGSVPIYTHEIRDIFYLHGDRVEQAFDDAGCGDKDDKWPMGWRPAAIYFYIQQEVNEWYHEKSEELFTTWQAEAEAEVA